MLREQAQQSRLYGDPGTYWSHPALLMRTPEARQISAAAAAV
ncbi:hypothetical protein AB0J72_52690 [Dactylosporangium sp. NPDC049742]